MSSDEDSCNRKREKFTCEKPVKQDSGDSAGIDSYGPALPPHLIASKDKQKSDEGSFGPQLPNNYSSNSRNEEHKEEIVYGPQIPNSVESGKVIGPVIPAHLLPPADSTEEEEEEEDATNEDDQSYGPSLSLMSDVTTGTETLPSSLLTSKRKESTEAKAKRESWMLELPPERANSFGLGPRQFRTRHANEKESDRSGWTETPTEKGIGVDESERVNNRKNDEKIINQKQIDERNEEMEKLVKKISKRKKREESLLEIHRKKMRKKEKKEARKREKEGTTAQRRPFDRNVDLQVQRFDLAQKNAILKKAALLNDRFASGESKFL